MPVSDAPTLQRLFNGKLISTTAPLASTVISDPVPSSGNKFVAAVTVLNSSPTPMGAGNFTVTVEGSYDGTTWKDSGMTSIQPTTFGYSDQALATNSFAMLRIKATLVTAT